MPRVLVVDDEKNVLTTLSIGLGRYDYTVQKAQSGPEALRIMEGSPCEIVVSDVRMSPMDGYTLVSRIREKYPWVAVVLMSAYGFEEEQSGEVERGAFSRLTKPFAVSDLVRILQEEDKKREKGRILAFGEEEGQKIKDILESDGFCVEVLDPAVNPGEQMQKVSYDLFLVDDDFLDERKWKILNEIDHYAPNKPVILLTRNSGERDYLILPGLGVMVLDREMFLQDRSWAVEFVKENIDKH